MNKINIIIFLCLSIFCRQLAANVGDAILDNKSKTDNYSYELSDQNQKKVASGQYAWGIVFFVAIAVFCGFMANSPAATNTSNPPTSDNVFSSGDNVNI